MRLIIESIATECISVADTATYAYLAPETSAPAALFDEMPIRIEHSQITLLERGSVYFSCNFKEYKVEGPAMISFPPGSILHINAADLVNMELHNLIFWPQFLKEINISFNAISGEALIDHETPVLPLQEGEPELMKRYFMLIKAVMTEEYNEQLTRHVLSSLAAALFYQFVSIVYKRIDTQGTETLGQRRGNYVQDFIRLVHLYYTKERSISFYASKLFISPKYLSLLVKEATGRSAAKWIDNFVIMEAKNLLRYSGKNIQQVAYQLNFSNQSAFGKYFKHLTGMSPTDFQKS